jgi:hypothetical protein
MTPREELAALLRNARKAAGYSSQGAYAKSVPCSRPLISRAESATQPVPSADVLSGYVAIGADEAEIKRLIEAMSSGSPEWFMPYMRAEAEAHTLRCWSPMLVPGLAQTPAYMRALFEDEGHLLGRIDELATARLERQTVIGRTHVTLIISQHVLYRLVGSPAIMSDQCAHLASMAEYSGVGVHVLPDGVNMGGSGAFDIASGDSVTTVRLETIEDVTSTARDLVIKAMQAFERILGAALPCSESLALIRTAEGKWKTQT